MAKFKNLDTGLILETENKEVISLFESSPFYENLDKAEEPTEEPTTSEAEPKAKKTTKK